RHYDPLYSYYRWHNRGNPGWSQGLQTVYQGRVAGTIQRPPRTLVQQNTIIQNNTTVVNNNIHNNINNLRLVTPAAQLTNSNLRLTKAAPSHLAASEEHMRALRQVAQQRSQLEK